jgi:hypothetical protein
MTHTQRRRRPRPTSGTVIDPRPRPPVDARTNGWKNGRMTTEGANRIRSETTGVQRTLPPPHLKAHPPRRVHRSWTANEPANPPRELHSPARSLFRRLRRASAALKCASRCLDCPVRSAPPLSFVFHSVAATQSPGVVHPFSHYLPAQRFIRWAVGFSPYRFACRFIRRRSTSRRVPGDRRDPPRCHRRIFVTGAADASAVCIPLSPRSICQSVRGCLLAAGRRT